MYTVNLFDSYTPVFHWNYNSEKRILVNQGGTSSSKTYSIDQVIATRAAQSKKTITVVANSSNALERGALRDFKGLINKSDALRYLIKDPTLVKGPYRFKNGSIVEFASLQNPETAKHGKRNELFLNEADSIFYESAKQLIMRTSERVYIDYNPTAKFWVHDEILDRDDCDFFISNYTHNKWCSKSTIDEIFEYRTRWYASGNQALFNLWQVTQNKHDFNKWNETSNSFWRNKWYVYGLGITGVVEGVIFEDINYIPFLPIGLRRKAYALDFGFSKDPTALSKCGELNGEMYAKEMIYERRLTTPNLMKRMIDLGINGHDIIIADSSNQDAIKQMQDAGFNVVPAIKGPGSIKAGIDALRGLTINITSDSHNWKLEQENYKFQNKNGQWSNEPIDAHNHLWDGLRYYYQHFHKVNKVRKTQRRSRSIRRIN